MKMMTDINKSSDEAIRLMNGADRDVEKAQAKIKQVWEAFTAAEKTGTPIVLSGAKNKTEWAKLINRTPRYCQMIAKDGSRKNQKKGPNSVRTPTVKDGDIVNVKRSDGVKWFIEKCKVLDGGTNGVWLKKIEDTEPTPAPVLTHIMSSRRRTLCENRFINRPLLKKKDRVSRKHGEKATCPDCLRFQKEAEERQREFDAGWEEAMRDAEAKKPAATVAVKRLTADETRKAITKWHNQYKEENQKSDDGTTAWFEQLLKAFDAEQVKHPEWLHKTVCRERDGFEKAMRSRIHLAPKKCVTVVMKEDEHPTITDWDVTEALAEVAEEENS